MASTKKIIIPLLRPEERQIKQSVLEMSMRMHEASEKTIRRLQGELGVPQDQGTAEVETLQLRIARMEKVVRETRAQYEAVVRILWDIEWGGKANPYHHICPVCAASKAVGHERGCGLARVLEEVT